MATATRRPSGDHVGMPGPKSESWILVTLPVATFTTDTAARRHMPSTSRNAIREPSGDHAAPIGWVAR